MLKASLFRMDIIAQKIIQGEQELWKRRLERLKAFVRKKLEGQTK